MPSDGLARAGVDLFVQIRDGFFKRGSDHKAGGHRHSSDRGGLFLVSGFNQKHDAFKPVIQLIKQHGSLFGRFDLVKGNEFVGHVKALWIAFHNTTRTAFEDRAGGGRFETCPEAGASTFPRRVLYGARPPAVSEKLHPESGRKNSRN